jgi:hypothetical protein
MHDAGIVENGDIAILPVDFMGDLSAMSRISSISSGVTGEPSAS